MASRSFLKFALLGLAIGVTALVVWQWRPADETAASATARRVPEERDGRQVLSETEGLDYTHTVEGRPRYRLRAEKQILYKSEVREWAGGIELVLFGGGAEEGGRRPVRITGARMTTRGNEGDAPAVVEIEGEVGVRLPDGGRVTAATLVYRDAIRVVTSDGDAVLRTGGLRIEAGSMRYDTRERRLRLQRRVRLGEDPEATGRSVPDGFRGEARRLDSELDSSEIELSGGRPHLRMAAAGIEAELVRLRWTEAGRAFEEIVAEERATATWRTGGASPAPILGGERIVLRFADGEPVGLTSTTVAGRRPRLDAESSGPLEADRLELRDDEDGHRRIDAVGEAVWRPSVEGLAMERLDAPEISLFLGPEGPEELRATGGVSVGTAGRDGSPGAAAVIRGDRMEVVWEGSEVTSLVWPDGLSYEAGDRRVEGTTGRYDADEGRWIVLGEPVARARTETLLLESESISIGTDESLRAEGHVEARLQTGQMAALGALFGDAAEVRVAAPALEVDPGGDLEFRDGTRVWAGEQLLVARTVELDREPARLRASGDLLINLIRRTAGTAIARTGEGSGEDEEEGTGEPEPIELVGGTLLVDESPPVMRLVKGAELREGERRLFGDRLVVRVDEAGRWQQVELTGDVGLEDPAGTASGARLDYDPRNGGMTLEAGSDAPAIFTDAGGVQTRSDEALQLTWTAEQVRIAAREQGRTRTVLVPRGQK